MRPFPRQLSRSWMRAALVAGLALGIMTGAQAQLFASPESIADAWLGQDASELLIQWPVDSDVKFSVSENHDTHETAYTYYFSVPAYYSFNYWTESTGQVVGMASGQGWQAPIYDQVQYSERVYHPEQEQCNVTFIADSQGTIQRYDFRGSNCKKYFRKWGKPA